MAPDNYREAIEASGLFDAEFYWRNYRDSIPSGQSPLDHYLTVGEAQGLLASPNFDPIVYKLRHPERQHASPLIDRVHNGPHADYRDVGALFRDVDVREFRMIIRYREELRQDWAKHASIIAENVDRTVRFRGGGWNYELRNPLPADVFARLDQNRPFAMARFTHGFWDRLDARNKLAARLRGDERCRHLSGREVDNLALRLLAREYLPQGGPGNLVENFFEETLSGLPDTRSEEDFWIGIALWGVPTFDDCGYGLDKDDLRDRLDLISGYFNPQDILFDGCIWKRWALSGDFARLAEATRSHPVIVVGPEKFVSLGDKWSLSNFRHVAIAPQLTHLIRYSILDRTGTALAAAVTEGDGAKPIVLFQCGSLTHWLIWRLRARFPNVFYLDVGQALDLWYWTDAPWMAAYRDTLCAANLFATPTPLAREPAPPGSAAALATAEVAAILRSDYLATGLVAPPPSQHICDLNGPFRKMGDKGWFVTLPAGISFVTDNNQAQRRSPLVLLESGKILGQGHDPHAEICDHGAGRYSFWLDGLYLSTSDGSDPNHNGRQYTINTTDLGHQARPTRIAAAEDDLPASVDSSASLILAGPYRSVGPNCWHAELPAEMEPLTDNPNAHRRSPLVFLEDGHELGPGHALHETIIKHGGGR